MKNATVCEIVITGGTEVGHDTGTYSHCMSLNLM